LHIGVPVFLPVRTRTGRSIIHDVVQQWRTHSKAALTFDKRAKTLCSISPMQFDRCACSYDAHARPQRAFAARVAQFARVEPGQAVIEFGAGTGALTVYLCAAEALVHATDISEGMVSLGRDAVPAASWSKLDAFRDPLPKHPAGFSPFGGRPPGLQISSGLLQWAEEPVSVLQRWKAYLAPGGRMVHAFPCEPCLMEWRRLVQESPLRWRDESGWCRAFSDAGLYLTRKAIWVDQTIFPSTLEMVRALHRSGVTGKPRLRAGRLRGALKAYEAEHRRTYGVVATWAWLAIEAVATPPL
jgi:SAM-dependent methyltransferase